MARLTGLEPATPGVTGRYSNQLSYNRVLPEVVIGLHFRIVKQPNDKKAHFSVTNIFSPIYQT